MAISKELMQFRAGEPEPVIERMAEIGMRRDGKEWVNLQPWVDDEFAPKSSLFKHWFSGRGFEVPTATWVPGHPGSSPAEVTQVGMTHGSGGHALAQLQDAGVATPDGWRCLQDHSKRGLVFLLPEPDPGGAVLWAIAAGMALAGELPVDDRWVAGFIAQA